MKTPVNFLTVTILCFSITILANAQNNLKEQKLVQQLNESFRENLTPKFYQNFLRMQRLVTLEHDCSNHPEIKFFRNPENDCYRLIVEEGCKEQMEVKLINLDGYIVFNAIFFYPVVDFRLKSLPEDTYYLNLTTASGNYTKSVQLSNPN